MAVQVGLSLVLLINAGLLVRSLQAIRAVDSGLRTDDVFVVYPGPRPGGYQNVDHDSYYDPVTMITAPALLLMTTLFACLGPAARAARVDPIVTVRAE